MSFSPLQKALADLLLSLGAVQTDQDGFTLKLHEQYPDAPRSPYFLNLRDRANPGKKGTLTPGAYALIALCWQELWLRERIPSRTHYCALPHAATPMVDALHGIMDRMRVFLEKRQRGDRRWIAGIADSEVPPDMGVHIALFDDVITGADTKIEGLHVLRPSYVVDHCLVVVDRQQGGVKALEAHQILVSSIFTVTDLMDYYAHTGQVDGGLPKIVREYIREDAAWREQKWNG